MINEVFDLDHFVNRDSELHFILEQCLESLRGNRPINPQFIEFRGVWGIGKTTILKRIEHHCDKEDFHPIWVEVRSTPDYVFRAIADQVRSRYAVSFKPEGDALDESLVAARALLEKYGRVVIFIDALDAAGEEYLKNIEELLHRFTEISKLLCIMASRKMIEFKSTRPVGRKLKFIPLKSFTRDHCALYIRKLAQGLKDEEIDQIILLTGGYPVAVNIAVRTITQENLDLSAELGRKRLIQILNEQVLEHGVLASIRQDPEELLWYQTMLSLFAVPRRFNLTIMQKMTEKFAEQYKLGSSLLYMEMLRRINLNTGLLDWDIARTGYFMESPVRHLFHVKLKTEDPDRYTRIHEFFMEQNWRLVMEVPADDRLRYIQEYLYHCAFCLDSNGIPDSIEKAMKQIPIEPAELWVQFHEEYQKDIELQDALGAHKEKVLSKIHTYFVDRYWELSLSAQDKQERVASLKLYILFSIKDPMVTAPDRLPLAQHCWQRIKAREAIDVCHSLFEVLSQDAEIKEMLGADPQAWNLK